MNEVINHPGFLPAVIAVIAIVLYFITRRRKTVQDPDPTNPWTYGPNWNGENYSKGLPLHPVLLPDGRWRVDLPTPAQQPHYLTKLTAPLQGKEAIEVVLDVEMEPGTLFPMDVDDDHPELGSQRYEGVPWASLYLERAGDDGRALGYRWYAATAHLIGPGRYVLRANLVLGDWKPVLGPAGIAEFNATLQQTVRAGVFLGGARGAGHGIVALKPARLTGSYKVM